MRTDIQSNLDRIAGIQVDKLAEIEKHRICELSYRGYERLTQLYPGAKVKMGYSDKFTYGIRGHVYLDKVLSFDVYENNNFQIVVSQRP